MVSQVIKDSFINLYNDDYRDSDNYYKILFNNGRGLQQRELNQMQTILNKDIGSMAGFLLDPGAATEGGSITVSDAPFIRLDTVTNPLPSNISSIEGVIFEETTTGIQVAIQKVVAASAGVPAQIFVKYVDQAGVEVTTDPITISNTSSTLVAQDGSGVELTTAATDNVTTPLTGTGLIVVQNPGRFFVDEHFIYSAKQILVLSNDSVDVEATVGHVVTESIVTVNDDQNLYDNSGANLNLAAPGADRYKITLTLTDKNNTSSSDYFIPLVEISEGSIANNQNEGAGQLKATEDFLAIRIKEMHGNFTQQNFIIDFEEDESNDDAFKIIVNPGKAYVGGARVYLRQRKTLTEARPRTTQVVNNETATITYGNYVVVSDLATLFNFTTAEKVNLKDAIGGGGTTIGSARVRAIEEFGTNFKVYLFDIKTNSGKNLAATKSIGITAGYSNIVLENDICKLYDQTNRNLFFELNHIRPKSFSDIVTTVQKLHTGTANGSGEITINAATGRAFDDTGSWIIVNETTNASVTGSISSAGASATISGLTSGESYKILAYEQHSGSSGTIKTKTLRNITDSGLSLNASNTAYLTKVDPYTITSITDDTTSADITDDFNFNNGQTESFYGKGLVTLKGGASAPSGTITIVYKYFDWSATGDFFAASSYTGTIDYEDIPSFRQSNGERVELRELIDFRPAQDGASYDVLPLPRNGDLVTMDTEYYLPVMGRIFVKKNGTFGVYFGEPAFNPQLEDLGNDLDVMEIANFYCNPYMLSADDVILNYTQNKRYTMRDIAHMDQRIEELKEFTTLSLLELSSANKDILDSDGLNRLKSGITADNFRDHYQTDVDDNEHSAAMDFIEGVVRPRTATNNIEMVFDSDASSGVKKKGDLIFLDYEDEVWQNQTSVSRLVGISEQVINMYEGTGAMSPASDSWMDQEKLPKKVIVGNPRLSVKIDNTYKYHDVSWRGTKIADLASEQNGNIIATGAGQSSSSITGGGKSTSTSRSNTGSTTTVKVSAQVTTTVTKTPQFKLDSSSIVKESLGEFIRARISIPTMRSRFVSFKFTGLRPNTRHFAFFGKTSVDDWVYAVSGLSEFTRMSDLPRTSPLLDAGDIYKKQTQYPLDGGPTQIVTDGDGMVSGYFLIPNTDSISFATGRQDFYLLDITAPNPKNATSKASFLYEANGTLEQVQEEELSTRIYQVRQSIKTTKVSTTIPSTSNSVFTPNPVRPYIERDSCFVKGTKVRMADGSIKNIEDVVIFDEIMGAAGPNTVKAYDHWPLDGRDLIGINGNGPFKTPEHPLMTRVGWKAYNSETTKTEKPEIAHLMVNGNLEVGDEIQMDDGSWTKVTSLEVFSGEPEQVVYNFYLDGDHTYYANGMLAHNRCDVDAGGDCQ